MKNILIASPIRNRSWILSEYLYFLSRLDYPKKNLSFHFILNDSLDSSAEILADWKAAHEKEYRYIRISEVNFDYPHDWGEDRVVTAEAMLNRKNKTYKSLSVLRNLILDLAWLDMDVDYLFSVDSDILVNPDILNKLLATNKDIVAGLIGNGNFNYNFMPLAGHRNILPLEKLFEVTTTGAVMLISRKVFENKLIRYSPEKTGEDEGFCMSARTHGFKSYVLQELQKHIMKRSEFND